MSGLEVLGGLAAVIEILDASLKAYRSARKDLKLPEAFNKVGARLPILLDTLSTCKRHLDPAKDSMPADVCIALEQIIDGCDQNAIKLREIFQRVISGENDGWKKRYMKVLQRFGKGHMVEELIIAITEDVQLLVNHRAVKSAGPEQLAELQSVFQEMKDVASSMPEEESAGMIFSSAGPQTNIVYSGSGQQINNIAVSGRHYYGSVTVEESKGFTFREPAGIRLGQAPYIDPKLFLGRASELEEMAQILKPGEVSEVQHRLVVGGKGGIGKTQLVIGYINLHHKDYLSAFWLDATNTGTLKDSFRSVTASLFGVSDTETLTDEQHVTCFHQWLSDRKNIQWLLVFDNYDDPDLFDLQRGYYPPASHGTIVVTTRRPDLVPGREIRIKPLSDTHYGLQILESRSQREETLIDPYAKSLVERLGNLPLALATAGAYLRDSHLTFKDYLQEYNKCWDVDPDGQFKLTEYHRTLHTTWNVSYTRLENQRPDAARLLRLLAYFDNQNIWYELIHVGVSPGSPEWLQDMVHNKLKFASVMRTLTNHCFIELQQHSAQSWTMHNCVHDWIRASLSKKFDQQLYLHAFESVGNSLTHTRYDDWPLLKDLPFVPHAIVLGSSMANLELSILHNSNSYAPNAYKIASLLSKHAQYALAEQMYTHALTSKVKLSTGESSFAIVKCDDTQYDQQDNLQHAVDSYNRVLAASEKVLCSEDILALQIVYSLGRVYDRQGKLDQAEQIHVRALARSEELLGPEHKITIRITWGLGIVYSHQKKFDQAEEVLKRISAMLGSTSGPAYFYKLRAVFDLGWVYFEQGKFDEAEKMFSQALGAQEELLGEQNPEILYTVHGLALVYKKTGKHEDAKRMFQRAVEGFMNMLGPDHPDTAKAVASLDMVRREWKDQNPDKNSKKSFRQAGSMADGERRAMDVQGD